MPKRNTGMMSSHAGYALARKVDAIINEALIKHPPENLMNVGGWSTFTRTIGTSLIAIKSAVRIKAEQNARAQRERAALKLR